MKINKYYVGIMVQSGTMVQSVYLLQEWHENMLSTRVLSLSKHSLLSLVEWSSHGFQKQMPCSQCSQVPQTIVK